VAFVCIALLVVVALVDWTVSDEVVGGFETVVEEVEVLLGVVLEVDSLVPVVVWIELLVVVPLVDCTVLVVVVGVLSSALTSRRTRSRAGNST